MSGSGCARARRFSQGAEFKELWDRIKHKTTYRVQFDNDGLIAQCARALQDAPQIPRTRLQWRKADIAIGQAGVQATERSGAATVVAGTNATFPCRTC